MKQIEVLWIILLLLVTSCINTTSKKTKHLDTIIDSMQNRQKAINIDTLYVYNDDSTFKLKGFNTKHQNIETYSIVLLNNDIVLDSTEDVRTYIDNMIVYKHDSFYISKLEKIGQYVLYGSRFYSSPRCHLIHLETKEKLVIEKSNYGSVIVLNDEKSLIVFEGDKYDYLLEDDTNKLCKMVKMDFDGRITKIRKLPFIWVQKLHEIDVITTNDHTILDKIIGRFKD